MIKIQDTEERNKDLHGKEPSYLTGYIKPSAEDETDYIDSWITLWAYRKLFLSSLVIFALVGTLCFKLLDSPKTRVNSVIEIRTIVLDGRRIPLVSPNELIVRLELKTIPKLSSADSYEEVLPFIAGTKISNIYNTNLIEIVSVVPSTAVSKISQFHNQIVQNILIGIEKSSDIAMADVRDNLLMVQGKIIQLQNFISDIERSRQSQAESKDGLYEASLTEIDIKKAALQSEIEILNERARHLKSMLLYPASEEIITANVSVDSGKLSKASALTLIFILSTLLAFFAVFGAITISKVKERIATED